MIHSSELSINPESVIVFLPIKPVYSKRIIDGTKRFEFRRSKINRGITHIIFYSSSPVKKIVAIAQVEEIFVSSPTSIWERTKGSAGISRRGFREYFAGKKAAIAISLKKVIPLTRPINPVEIEENFYIPQSFKYVDDFFLVKVASLGLERSC